MSDIQLCPLCGSGKVKVTDRLAMLSSGGLGQASCPCGWSGAASALVISPMELGQAENIAAAVATEYMRALAVYAGAHIGRAMVAVGLITTSEKKDLARLIRATVIGAHRATLDEIEKIQQEIKNGDAS